MSEPKSAGSYAEYLAATRGESTRNRLRWTDTAHHDHVRTVMDVHRLSMAQMRRPQMTPNMDTLNRVFRELAASSRRAGDSVAALDVVLEFGDDFEGSED